MPNWAGGKGTWWEQLQCGRMLEDAYRRKGPVLISYQRSFGHILPLQTWCPELYHLRVIRHGLGAHQTTARCGKAGYSLSTAHSSLLTCLHLHPTQYSLSKHHQLPTTKHWGTPYPSRSALNGGSNGHQELMGTWWEQLLCSRIWEDV